MTKEKKATIIYLIVTFFLCCICYCIFFIAGENASAILALLIFSPALVAVIIRIIFYKKEPVLGFKVCRFKYILLAILIPLVYLGVSYGSFLVSTPAAFTGELSSISIISFIVEIFSGILLVMGEEIGWRGFLLPRLDLLLGQRRAIIINGLIWALLHFPLMIAGLYPNGTPLWYQLPMFTVEAILITAIMAYLRFRSGSLWPVILLHESHNYIDQQLCTPLTQSANSAYFAGETGILTVLCTIVIVIIIYRKKPNKPF